MEGPEAMDLEKADPPKGAGTASSCSICLEPVLDLQGRSTAKLQCGHEFHLDCIGSAFNAKGAMQCPNCRKVEKGQWFYANGHRPSTEFDLDNWVAEEVYDLSYSELPFGFQWCPIRGLTQLASLFEEGEPHFHSIFGDHSSASSSSHVCPYLALRGFPHPVHTAPSGANDPIPENGPFHRHPANLGGQLAGGDMISSHNFSVTEAQSLNWQPQPSLSYSGNPDQATSQFASRVSRNDTGTHQRLGSFVHPHALLHGTVARTGSNMIPGQPILGEVRSHARGNGGHIYQHSVPSSLQTSPFAPVRRPRPRGLTTYSSMGSSSSADIGGLYGIPLAGSVNRNHPDGESIGRDFERFHGWSREGGSTLPWVPADRESQWWSAFHPNQNQVSGSTELLARHIYPQRPAGERVTQGRPEAGYHPRMPPPRMPPYM